ncbi:EF-hand domain [Dillenia turbinata]|uniref:EF-hand domain n=1 Tax=Dillenia turbinata TaxID=194707 RepID=A0AAN8UNM8_9MAGN
MPTILHRIFLLYTLVNSILLYLVPKKLWNLLPPSWFPLHTATKTSTNSLSSHPSPLPSPLSLSLSSSPLSSPRTHQRMDPNELKRVFQMFDKNGDGRITKKELNDSLENLGIFISDKDLIQMIEKIDVNGDGCVDMEEFGTLYQTIMDEKDEEEDMREAFNVFDQNGDGYISVEELRSVLSSLGLKQGRTVEDCKKMIMKVDVDGDGMVNYNEFKQMMRGGGFAALS